MKYPHITAEFCSQPWAILPEKLHAIAELIAFKAAGGNYTAEEIEQRIGHVRRDNQAATSKLARAPGSVALIPVYGVITYRANLMSSFSGGTSIQKLTSAFRQALGDESVKAIVFDIDSPGGSVDGVPEFAQEVKESRGQKKTIAVANTMAASAAYWIGSAADELVVTPSGEVGSIGVWAAHEDISKALEAEGVKISMISAGKFKTEGNPYEPLSEEARAAMQAMVDDCYDRFVKAVAGNRFVSQQKVLDGFGQGRMVLPDEALKQGMVDKIETLDQTLARLGVSKTTQPAAIKSNSFRERELAAALYQ